MDKYSDKLILEFTLNEYERNENLIKKIINNKDTIHLVGGGNFGYLYKYLYNARYSFIFRK